MIYLYYSERYAQPGERLHKAIRSFLPEEPMERMLTIENLGRELAKPFVQYKDTVIVFLASDNRELLKLRLMDEMLASVSLILIVNDYDEETFVHVHRLYPRYLADVDEDFTTLAQVVKNILYLYQPF